jgi:hypothetical protein
VTVALCIATAKMFAFYPTLIDLGALAALSAATYVVLTRDGWAAGAAALLAARRLVAAPELVTFAAVILAAAAVGNADIWRYLAFLLPVITILYAGYVRDHRPGVVVLAAACLFTLATQQPFTQMDMTHYFRDWFPVYVARTDDATPAFWSMWRLRLVITAAAAVTLGIVQWKLLRRSDPSLTQAPSPMNS